MKLPKGDKAQIAESKITGYLLSLAHEDGRAKAEKTMIKELDRVILSTNLPEHSLKSGDIGTVVLMHDLSEGFEVEFVSLDGETVAVVSLFTHQVRPIGRREIAHARPLALPH